MIRGVFRRRVAVYQVKVPIDAAVQAALQKLEDDPSLADLTTLTPAQIADLLTFVLISTYFRYNGSINEQQEGAAMGSRVSAVITNLYMESFEEQAAFHPLHHVNRE